MPESPITTDAATEALHEMAKAFANALAKDSKDSCFQEFSDACENLENAAMEYSRARNRQAKLEIMELIDEV